MDSNCPSSLPQLLVLALGSRGQQGGRPVHVSSLFIIIPQLGYYQGGALSPSTPYLALHSEQVT